MRDEIKRLIPTRTRRGQGREADWESLRALIGLLFARERDASLYCTKKLSQKIGYTASSIISYLQEINTYSSDLVTRVGVFDTSSLKASIRSLAGVSVDEIGENSASSRPYEKFRSNSATFLNQIRPGMGQYSPTEASSVISQNLEYLVSSKDTLETLLDLFTAVMDDYKAAKLGPFLVNTAAARALKILEDYLENEPSEFRQTMEQVVAVRNTLKASLEIAYPAENVLEGTGAADVGEESGEAASITGSKSGPFILTAPNTVLKLTVDGTTSGDISLGQATQASMATTSTVAGDRWLLGPTASFPPGTTTDIVVSVNGSPDITLSVTVVTDTGNDYIYNIYPTGVGLKDAWDACGYPITTTYAASVLTVKTSKAGEDASLKVISCSAKDNAWDKDPAAAVGYAIGAPFQGTWVTAKQIISAMEGGTTAKVEEDITDIVDGTNGLITSSSVIYITRLTGTSDLVVSSGNSTVTCTDTNLEVLKPAWKILADPGGGDETEFTIVSVSGKTAVVDPTPTITGTYSFRAYADVSSLPTGTIITTKQGPRVIKSTSKDAVTIADNTYFRNPDTSDFSISVRKVKITSPSTDSTSNVRIVTTPTELGLSTTEVRGEITGWETQESLTGLTIREGDRLVVGASSVLIKNAATIVNLKAGLSNNASGAYTIKNTDYEAWNTAQAQIATWKATYLSELDTLISKISRVLRTKTGKDLQVSSLQTMLATSISNLQSLKTIADNYTIRYLGIVDLMIQIVEELGLDRVKYLLETCQFSKAFALTKDELTYAEAFTKQTRTTIRTLANTSRYEDSAYTELAYYWQQRPEKEILEK